MMTCYTPKEANYERNSTCLRRDAGLPYDKQNQTSNLTMFSLFMTAQVRKLQNRRVTIFTFMLTIITSGMKASNISSAFRQIPVFIQLRRLLSKH
jgi:hypothetical protein